MEAQLALVRSALQALYSAPDGATRKAADNWLQNFRNSSGSWQLCLALLSRPGLTDCEYHFAAHSLRLACCKVPEVLDPSVLQGLAVQLATLLLASVGGAAWPVAGQLSSALAALAVRAVCWEAEALVPQLLSLLAPQVAAAMLADLALGGAAAGLGVGVGIGGGQGGGAAVLGAAVGAEATAVFALLQVVTGLPEACAARAVSAHPQRKAQVAAALAADATVVPLLRATVVGSRALDAAAAGGLSVHMPLGLAPAAHHHHHHGAAAAAAAGLPRTALRRAGLQLLHAWAEQLGTAPRGLEHEAELVSCLYEALATPDTATLAAECLCGLLTTCSTQPRRDPVGEDGGYQSDTSSSSSGMVMAEPVRPGRLGGGAGGAGGGGGGHRRAIWGEAAGLRKSRQGPGGGGGGGARGGHGGAGRAPGGMAAGGGGGGAAMAAPERQLASALLLQRLLDGLQALLQGAAMVYREQQQQMSGSSGDGGALAFWSGWSDASALQAVCSVLCSAAAAVLPGALLLGDTGLQGRFNALWPQLMALLGHSNPEVALSSVSFWQDVYLAQLMQACTPPNQPHHQPQQQQQLAAAGGPHAPGQIQGGAQGGAGGGAAVLQSHLPLLAQLLGGLVSRAALGPEAAAVATADARDLPEEVRMVRRELGATMRDLVGLVGLGHVAAFLERMISEHAAQLGAADGRGGGGAAAGAAGGPASAWTRLESSLYAANVALCSGGSGGGRPLAAGGDGGGAAVGPPVDDAHVASIISTAAAAVVHPASSLKLAGTALTLVGGMAGWFSEHPLELARPLESVRAALASPDEKLARNAATALNRLCVHGGCSALLLGRYAGWLGGLRALLPGPEVTLRHKPAPGVDMTSRELLVASLMRLACGTVTSAPPQPIPPQQQTLPPPSPPHQLQQQHQQQQQHSLSRSGSISLSSSTSRAGSRDLDSSSSSAGAAAAALPPQLLLQQLLTPRVLAAASELQRLAAALAAASASGVLPAHLRLWRISRQSQQLLAQHPNLQLQLQQHYHPQAVQQLQHCQQHCPQPCHHHHHHEHGHTHGHGHAQGQQAQGQGFGGGGGASRGVPRVPLCQPGCPQELQTLGAAALAAAQRLGGLASMLLFVPAAGQVQDMGAGVSGGRRGGPDAGGRGGAAAPPQDAASAPASAGVNGGAAAAAVVALVVQVVRAVWPNLMACLRPSAGGGAAAATAGQAADSGVAGGAASGGGGGASLLLETYEGAHLLPAACSLLQGALLLAASPRAAASGGGGDAAAGAGATAASAELLSCAVCLLDLSHGAQPVPPTEQQLQQQQWPENLDWPAEAGGGGGGGGRGGMVMGLQPQAILRALWQGPPVCILKLVLGCLPLCGRILAQQQQGQQQGQQAEGQASLVSVAEQGVRAACLVARSACASLQVPPRVGRPVGQFGGGPSGAALSSLDSDRILHVLPILQSLLLHTPQALAASRELLECLVAATVTCMTCHDPEACRAVLDWTQLLLCTTAYAAQVPPQPPPPQALQAARGAAAAGGLAALHARCSQAPALERAYARIAAQLDAPCLCAAPNAMGLVYAVAPAAPTAPGGGAGAAVGSLGSVLVLSLMVAAAGGMPPDLMLPISVCLHSAWLAMGGARFRAWMRAAAVDLSSSPPPGVWAAPPRLPAAAAARWRRGRV